MESLLAAEVDIVCLLLMMKTCFASGRHENLSFYFYIYYFPFFQALFLILLLKKRKKSLFRHFKTRVELLNESPLENAIRYLHVPNFCGWITFAWTHTKEGFAVIGSVTDDVSRKKPLMSISSNLFRAAEDEKTP